MDTRVFSVVDETFEFSVGDGVFFFSAFRLRQNAIAGGVGPFGGFGLDGLDGCRAMVDKHCHL